MSNLPGSTIGPLIGPFLTDRSHKIRTEASRRSYRNRLRLLSDMYPGKRVNRYTEADLVAFCKDATSTATQVSRRVAVKSFYSWAFRAGHVKVDPAAHLNEVFDVRVKPTKTHNWLDEHQVTELLRQAGSRRDLVGLMVPLFTGLRATEITGLRWDHINLTQGFLNVIGKGEKPAIVGVPGQLAQLLTEWKAEVHENDPESQIVIPRMRHDEYGAHETTILWGTPLGYTGYVKLVARAGETIGVPSLRPHDLRRTFAGLLESKDVPLQAISAALRHSNVGTTQRYLESNPAKVLSTAAGFTIGI